MFGDGLLAGACQLLMHALFLRSPQIHEYQYPSLKSKGREGEGYVTY